MLAWANNQGAAVTIPESTNEIIQSFPKLRTGERVRALETLLAQRLSTQYLKECLNLSRFDLSHYRRLSRALTPAVIDLIDRGNLSLRHARVIGQLDRKQQESFARDVIQRRWSVSRATEQAKSLMSGEAAPANSEYYDSIAEQISEQIGHPVKVAPDKANPRSGTITINYADFECFDSILSRMKVRLRE